MSSGILRTDGRVILNDNNEKVILKGFGLGGWLVLEGYMWNYPGFGSTTTMENAVEYLLGEQKKNEFFERYRSNYITEKDISFLAENADMITVSTAPLKAKMSAFNKNVVVVPNCLDADIWQLYKDRDHTSGPFARNPSGPIKIGYIGTNTHQEDLEVIAGAMNQIKDKYGSKVEIEVIGAFQNHPVKFGNRVALPKNTDYPSFVEWLLKRVHWDIGVIPLVDDDFNKSKSNKSNIITKWERDNTLDC